MTIGKIHRLALVVVGCLILPPLAHAQGGDGVASEASGDDVDIVELCLVLNEAAPDPSGLDADSSFAAGECQRRFGEPAKALPYYDRLIELDPDALRPRLERARALHAGGRYRAARRTFAALMEQPSLPGVVEENIELAMSAIPPLWHVSGSIEAGIGYTDNANLGPEDPTFRYFGLEVEVDEESQPKDSFGADLGVRVRPVYTPRRDRRLTLPLDVVAERYREEEGDDIASLSFSPTLSYLIEEAARLDGYVSATLRFDGGDIANRIAVAGARFSRRVGPVTLAAGPQLGYNEDADNGESSELFFGLRASLDTTPHDLIRLGVLGSVTRYRADGDGLDRDRFLLGGRLELGPVRCVRSETRLSVEYADYEGFMASFDASREDRTFRATEAIAYRPDCAAGGDRELGLELGYRDTASSIEVNRTDRFVARVFLRFDF